MLIEVTQKHIEHGRRGECSHCPVALALQDYGFKNVSVYGGGFDHGTVKQKLDATSEFVVLPDFVSGWISNFDYQGTGEPFSFELQVPA